MSERWSGLATGIQSSSLCSKVPFFLKKKKKIMFNVYIQHFNYYRPPPSDWQLSLSLYKVVYKYLPQISKASYLFGTLYL